MHRQVAKQWRDTFIKVANLRQKDQLWWLYIDARAIHWIRVIWMVISHSGQAGKGYPKWSSSGRLSKVVNQWKIIQSGQAGKGYPKWSSSGRLSKVVNQWKIIQSGQAVEGYLKWPSSGRLSKVVVSSGRWSSRVAMLEKRYSLMLSRFFFFFFFFDVIKRCSLILSQLAASSDLK